MKTKAISTVFLVALLAQSVRGQGIFVYDQQSADERTTGEAIVGITSFQQPVGQSFTPALSEVGFIRLEVYDGDIINGSGATLRINLLTGSITGPALAFSEPVVVPNGFNGGFVDFFFSSPASVIPGVVYYFQPVILSGDGMLVGRLTIGDYPGGTEYANGQPGFDDLWFREGIVVPEPSAAALLLLGSGLIALQRFVKILRRSRA